MYDSYISKWTCLLSSLHSQPPPTDLVCVTTLCLFIPTTPRAAKMDRLVHTAPLLRLFCTGLAHSILIGYPCPRWFAVFHRRQISGSSELGKHTNKNARQKQRAPLLPFPLPLVLLRRWAGNIWASTGCTSGISGYYEFPSTDKCVTNFCSTDGVCPDYEGPSGATTKAEFAMIEGGLDFYDVSIIDGRVISLYFYFFVLALLRASS